MTSKMNRFLSKDSLPATLLVLLNLHLLCIVTCLEPSPNALFHCHKGTHLYKGSCIPEPSSCTFYQDNLKCKISWKEFQRIVELDQVFPSSMFFGFRTLNVKWGKVAGQQETGFMQDYREYMFEYFVSLGWMDGKKSKLNFWKLFISQLKSDKFRLAKNKKWPHLQQMKPSLYTQKATFQINITYSQNSVRVKIFNRLALVRLQKIKQKAQENAINTDNKKICLLLKHKLSQVQFKESLKCSIEILINFDYLLSPITILNTPFLQLYKTGFKDLKQLNLVINTKHYKIQSVRIIPTYSKNFQITQIDNPSFTKQKPNKISQTRILLQTTNSQKIQLTSTKQLYNIKSTPSINYFNINTALAIKISNIKSDSINSFQQQDRSANNNLLNNAYISPNFIPILGAVSSVDGVVPQVNKIPNITTTPETDVPNLQLLDQNLIYIQYLDNVVFLKTTVYEGIRSFLLKYNPEAITQSQFLRISVADNGKYYFFQTVWQILVKSQDIYYYTFVVDKVTSQMLLAFSMKLPRKTTKKYVLDDTNRDTILSQIEPIATQTIQILIQTSEYYNKNSKIFQINLSFFDTQNTTNLFSSFKYYSPPQLNLTYEYITYRFLINSTDIKNSQKLGPILSPVQQYINTGNTNISLNQSMNLYVSLNVIKDPNDNFTILEIWRSTSRIFFYRILISVNQKWLVNYQIDLNNATGPRLRSNQSINNPVKEVIATRGVLTAGKNFPPIQNQQPNPSNSVTSTPTRTTTTTTTTSTVPSSASAPVPIPVPATASGPVNTINRTQTSTLSFPDSVTQIPLPQLIPITPITTNTVTSAQAPLPPPTTTTNTQSTGSIITITVGPRQNIPQNTNTQQPPNQPQLPNQLQPPKQQITIPKSIPSIQLPPISLISYINPQSSGPVIYDLKNFLANFPTRLKTITKIPIVSEYQAAKVGQFFQSQIKQKIGSFFRTSTNAINDLRIQKRQKLLDLLDTYTVDYTEFLPPRNLRTVYQLSRRCRFIFQTIPKRVYDSNIFYPLIGKSAGVSTENLNNNINTRVSESQMVVVTPDVAISKPIKFLAAIFNRTFIVQGTKDIASPPIQVPLNSPNDPRYYPTITSSANPISNSDKIVNDFLTKIPDIIPLKFIQNPQSQNPQSLPLQQPTPVTPKSSLFLDQLTSPAVYHSSLIDSKIERVVQNKANYKMLSYKHNYYGDVRVWANLADQKILQINYTGNGFMLSSTDIKIIQQIPEVMTAQKVAAQQISVILAWANYSELFLGAKGVNPNYRISRPVALTDLIYWKYNRLQSLIQLELFYKFSEFIIKAGMILDTSNNITPAIASLEVICNKMKRLKQDEKRDQDIQMIMKRPEWPTVIAYLNTKIGPLIKNVKLESLLMQTVGMENFYSFTYQTQGNRTKVNLVYSYLTKRVRFLVDYQAITVSTQPQKGCRIQNFDIYKCTACLDGLIFQQKNGQCYDKIPNCNLQTGELCLACDLGFIINQSYQCQ